MGRPQVSGIALHKRSQPAERVYSTESLEDTAFPVLLRTVKGGSFSKKRM